MTVEAVIVGAGGYSGAQLAGMLLAHEDVTLVALFGSDRAAAAPRFDELHPRWRGATDLRVEPAAADAIARLGADAIFLATPHEVSAELAAPLLASGATVFDLSGAFRLGEPGRCAKHYGLEIDGALLGRAVYGLPERNAAAIAEADLVALPGCYPTASILPLAPLAAAGAIDAARGPVIIDAVSGVSGAGRAPSTRTHFCEVSLQPYGVFEHRHAPEIALHAGLDEEGLVFTPHIAPFDRGVLATIHVPLARGWDEAAVRAALAEAYGSCPFVRLLPAGQWPSVGAVRETCFCDVGLRVDPARRHLIAVSAIDNLLKGAAGQAVQCMNLRFGLPETAGLAVPAHRAAAAAEVRS